MSAWIQRVFDWEKGGRDAAALDLHLRLAGLQPADRRLLVAIKEHGQWVRDGSIARSVLRATQRKVAKLADLSPGAVHKAKGRLVARGLVQYRDGCFVASWPRVWALEPLPDPAIWSDGPPATAAGGPTPPVSAHGRSRAPQEQRRNTPLPNPNQPKNYQVGLDLECVPVGAVLGGDFETAAAALYQRQLDGVASRLLCRLEPIEARHGVEPQDRLQPTTARRIAAGICNDPDANPADEVERIFASLARREAFAASPAAYLVACAKRRRWLPDRDPCPPAHVASASAVPPSGCRR